MIVRARCRFCLSLVSRDTRTSDEFAPCPARNLFGDVLASLPHVPESDADRMTRQSAEGAARRARFGGGKRRK